VEIDKDKISIQPGDLVKGLVRWSVRADQCALYLDVLGQAVVVSRADPSGAACVFAAADCQVNPAGLWGPPGDTLVKEAATTQKARTRADNDMRQSFRFLLKGLGDNHGATRALAADQAGFSARRTETCAAYAREELHGFCALHLSEAWLYELNARIYADPAISKAALAGKPTASRTGATRANP
jgi:hypothetical protein